MLEKTLSIIKPDAVERNLEEKIQEILVKKGLVIKEKKKSKNFQGRSFRSLLWTGTILVLCQIGRFLVLVFGRARGWGCMCDDRELCANPCVWMGIAGGSSGRCLWRYKEQDMASCYE